MRTICESSSRSSTGISFKVHFAIDIRTLATKNSAITILWKTFSLVMILRPSSRGFVDFPRALHPPRDQQQERPSSSRHKTTYASQSQSFSLHISFILPFFSTSRLALSNNAYRQWSDTKPLPRGNRTLPRTLIISF